MEDKNDNVNQNKRVQDVPIWKKLFLTLSEAAELFNICPAKLRELTDKKDCKFVLFNGNKRLINREALYNYLTVAHSI